MAAPIIGSMLLLYTSWWGAFVLLAFLGSINIIIALLLMEPLLPENDIPGRWYSLWDCLSNSPDMRISG